MNIAVAPGDLLSIMGPSGCGKSTLMNIVGLLDHPSAGRRWLDGRELVEMDDDDLSAVRNASDRVRVPVLPPPAAPDRGGATRVCPCSTGVSAEREVRARALAALDAGGDGRSGRPSSGTSSPAGQQQRVALARALVGEPALVLADEPTGALDPATTEQVMDTFERLCDEHGLAVVIVTHSPEVEARCRRRTRLEDGRLVETTR